MVPRPELAPELTDQAADLRQDLSRAESSEVAMSAQHGLHVPAALRQQVG